MSETPRIRVLTVDDHPLMMAGISVEINDQPDMKVVGEATDGDMAVACYRALLPNITLMDLRMPKKNGIEAIEEIRREFPTARIIVLTTNAGDMLVVRALKAGAVGYLLKNLLRTELVGTIRRVHAGQRLITPEVTAQIAEHIGEDQITSRELAVLRGVAEGQSNRLIASALHITEHTVKGHVKNILAKLEANDRTQAVMIALRRGLLDL